ncbi:MAG: histidine kinase [Salinivirgaceae bacterium]|jgi:two-component system LytT family sensor kinase|nr:histidine kinase [Salinivirgaceae bacterium]
MKLIKDDLFSWHAAAISTSIASVLTFFFGLRMYLSSDPLFIWQTMVINFSFTFAVAYLITTVDYVLIYWFQEMYPWQKNNIKRISFELIVTSIAAALVMVFIFSVFHLLVQNPDPKTPAHISLIDNVGMAIMVNLVMVGIEESRFLVKQWKESILQQEKLKRQYAETQYHALNQQVNPHFLFNSLNTLASLIPHSPEQSLKFVHRFSDVYRYVLESGQQSLVTVAEELNFIKSYLFLNQLRHGEGLQTTIEIDNTCLNHFIPPLSLQILIENALKHNETSIANPLYLHIYDEGGIIVVKNNYKPRNNYERPSGFGIKNLQNRYQYLTETPISTKIENNNFVARIPVILTDEPQQ